jgi:hypothetical protein
MDKGEKSIKLIFVFAFIPCIPCIPVHNFVVFIAATDGGKSAQVLRGKRYVAEAGGLNSRKPKGTAQRGQSDPFA